VRITLQRKLALGGILGLSVSMIIVAIVRVAVPPIAPGVADTTWIFFLQFMEASIALVMVSISAFRSILGQKSERSSARKASGYNSKGSTGKSGVKTPAKSYRGQGGGSSGGGKYSNISAPVGVKHTGGAGGGFASDLMMKSARTSAVPLEKDEEWEMQSAVVPVTAPSSPFPHPPPTATLAAARPGGGSSFAPVSPLTPRLAYRPNTHPPPEAHSDAFRTASPPPPQPQTVTHVWSEHRETDDDAAAGRGVWPGIKRTTSVLRSVTDEKPAARNVVPVHGPRARSASRGHERSRTRGSSVVNAELDRGRTTPESWV